HLAGLESDLLSIAGEIIGPLAIDLDGGEDRRGLVDLPDEARQYRLDLLAGGTLVAARDHLPFSIVAVGRLAPAHGEAIGLVALHHPGDGLGGFTEGQRKKP